ncbi:MAG: GDP-mannose 4,6-dehydratase [Euryarchaeota archaeon]|nr:GDP-mannose 4,6-dehydratase [Euryarchaeota archaeon]
MMKIVITGGTRFIGSNLAEELSKKHEVVIIDNLPAGRAENVEGLDVELVRGSITDPDLPKENFRGVDHVFHQAALPSVRKSVDDPVLANEANVCETLNVLVATRDAGVAKVNQTNAEIPPIHEPGLPALLRTYEGIVDDVVGANMLAAIGNVTERKAVVKHIEKQRGDVKDTPADADEIDKLGWKPRAGIEERVRRFAR